MYNATCEEGEGVGANIPLNSFIKEKYFLTCMDLEAMELAA